MTDWKRSAGFRQSVSLDLADTTARTQILLDDGTSIVVLAHFSVRLVRSNVRVERRAAEDAN